MINEEDYAALHPTPTRMGLLKDVDAGLVQRVGEEDWLDFGTPTQRKVTARIGEMRQAGWVVLVHLTREKHVYRVAPGGRLVLAEARRREAAQHG
jgi:hypothetical protein